jgi:hypothetical protein
MRENLEIRKNVTLVPSSGFKMKIKIDVLQKLVKTQILPSELSK